MKKLTQIFLFSLLSTISIAQQKASNNLDEIGINVNVFLNKIIFNKNIDETVNPLKDQLTTFYYRHFFKDNLSTRVSFGYDRFSKKDSLGISFISGIVVRKHTFSNFAFQIGISDYFLDSKKLKGYIGFEWIFRYKSQKLKESPLSSNMEEENQKSNFIYRKNNLGIAIPIGFKYFIKNRISIATEMNLELMSSFIFSNSRSGSQSSNNDSHGLNLIFRPPLTLFLNFHF